MDCVHWHVCLANTKILEIIGAKSFASRCPACRLTNSIRALYSVAARGFLPPGANVCVAAPSIVRSAIYILMGTTMALVWTVNSTLIWECNCVMQWNLVLSVATAKKKTAAHTFCRPSYCAGISSVSYCSLLTKPPNTFCSANTNSPEKRPNFRIPLQMPPPAQCRPGRMPPFAPLSAATDFTYLLTYLSTVSCVFLRLYLSCTSFFKTKTKYTLFVLRSCENSGYLVVFCKQPKIVHVLDLWLKNGVYTSEIIQPLLDLAAAPHSSEVFRAGRFAAYAWWYFLHVRKYWTVNCTLSCKIVVGVYVVAYRIWRELKG